MMDTQIPGIQIWLATAPIDMRKGFDRLAEVVRTFLGQNPLSGHLFVFRNRTSQRVKILWWDGTGFVLYYKRLERGTVHFPTSDDTACTIDSTQLLQLLAGLELVQRRAG